MALMESITLAHSPLAAVLRWRARFLNISPDITSQVNGPRSYLRALKERHPKTVQRDKGLGLYNRCERYVATTLDTEAPPRVGAQAARKLAKLPKSIREALDPASLERFGSECRVLELLYEAQACQYTGDIVGELGCLECVLTYLPATGFEGLQALVKPRVQYARVSLAALGTATELEALEEALTARVQEERDLGLPPVTKEEIPEQPVASLPSSAPIPLKNDVAKVRRFMEGGWGIPRRVLTTSKTAKACLRLINACGAPDVTFASLVAYTESTHPLRALGALALASLGLAGAAGALATKGEGLGPQDEFLAALKADNCPEDVALLAFDAGEFLERNRKIWLLQAADVSRASGKPKLPPALPIPFPEFQDLAVARLPAPSLSGTGYTAPQEPEAEEGVDKTQTPTPPQTVPADADAESSVDQNTQPKRRGLLSWVRWPFGKKE